jgi:hypothetical protein
VIQAINQFLLISLRLNQRQQLAAMIVLALTALTVLFAPRFTTSQSLVTVLAGNGSLVVMSREPLLEKFTVPFVD